FDFNNAYSVDVDNRTLDDSANTFASVDWDNRILADSTSNQAVDWQNRTLKDTSSVTLLDWHVPGVVTITGNLGATNFSGTSSGTNTGDQDLSGLVPKTTAVNGHALSSNVTVTASDVGLGNVTNDTQTKSAIVPNTAPSSGQVLIGNAGGTAFAPQ